MPPLNPLDPIEHRIGAAAKLLVGGVRIIAERIVGVHSEVVKDILEVEALELVAPVGGVDHTA